MKRRNKAVLIMTLDESVLYGLVTISYLIGGQTVQMTDSNFKEKLKRQLVFFYVHVFTKVTIVYNSTNYQLCKIVTYFVAKFV